VALRIGGPKGERVGSGSFPIRRAIFSSDYPRAVPTGTAPPVIGLMPPAVRAAGQADILDVSGDLVADLLQTIQRLRRGCADHPAWP
jgi:hypothetical protein